MKTRERHGGGAKRPGSVTKPCMSHDPCLPSTHGWLLPADQELHPIPSVLSELYWEGKRLAPANRSIPSDQTQSKRRVKVPQKMLGTRWITRMRKAAGHRVQARSSACLGLPCPCLPHHLRQNLSHSHGARRSGSHGSLAWSPL